MGALLQVAAKPAAAGILSYPRFGSVGFVYSGLWAVVESTG
jgi:hypothetical protein